MKLEHLEQLMAGVKSVSNQAERKLLDYDIIAKEVEKWTKCEGEDFEQLRLAFFSALVDFRGFCMAQNEAADAILELGRLAETLQEAETLKMLDAWSNKPNPTFRGMRPSNN